MISFLATELPKEKGGEKKKDKTFKISFRVQTYDSIKRKAMNGPFSKPFLISIRCDCHQPEIKHLWYIVK